MKDKRGGKRKGAGRKPIHRLDKKLPITIWISKSQMEEIKIPTIKKLKERIMYLLWTEL